MRLKTAALLIALCCLSLALFAGTASADHGSDNTNFTVTPEDRDPGSSDVNYRFQVELTDTVDRSPRFTEPERLVFALPEGTLETCEGESGTFTSTTNYDLYVDQYNGSGYERADYEVDSAAWDGDTVEFQFDYGRNDDPPQYAVDDILVLELDSCVTNPDSEDWHQGAVLLEGQSPTDRNITLGPTASHYFAVCSGCESDADGESKLGRPPSATPTPTETPTPTATPTPSPSPTPTPIATVAPTATPEPTASDTPEPTPSDTPETGSNNEDVTTETATDDDDGEPPIDTDFFGMDPFVVVSFVAGLSIALAALGAQRL